MPELNRVQRKKLAKAKFNVATESVEGRGVEMVAKFKRAGRKLNKVFK